jgi:hypothetical protein
MTALVAEERIPHTVPAFISAGNTFDVGMDAASIVGDRYADRKPFAFTGKLKRGCSISAMGRSRRRGEVKNGGVGNTGNGVTLVERRELLKTFAATAAGVAASALPAAAEESRR